jgi:integrase
LLAESTGRRISSILALRWLDLDFKNGRITWRAEYDKKRRGWLTPLPEDALKPLLQFRQTRSMVGNAFLFPSNRDERRPISRHAAAYWLKRALRMARLPKPEGSLWHCLRRKWATDRKALPLPDVLAAGGWNSPEAYYRCYARATMDGMRNVVDLPKGNANKLERQPIRQALM